MAQSQVDILPTTKNVFVNALKQQFTNFVSRLFRVPIEDESGDLAPEDQLGITPIPFGGPAIYSDPNALRFVQYGFSGNSSVYTIVTLIARKFGYIPRYVYNVADEKAYRTYNGRVRNRSGDRTGDIPKLQFKAYSEDLVEAEPGVPSYPNLINRPNPGQGQDSFFELACINYILQGECFIWLNRGELPVNDDGTVDDRRADELPPLEMYVLPSQYIYIIPNKYDVWGVDGYWFLVGGFQMFIRKNDMIVWKTPNPNFDAYSRQHLRGFSPLNPGNKILTQDDSTLDAQVALMQNSGAKGAMIMEVPPTGSPQNLTVTQESQLRDVIDRKVNNRDLRGSVAMLAGKWQYLNMGQTSVEMEISKAQEANFVRMCNLLGVPSELFLNGGTYQNKLQARKDFLTNLVLPLSASLKDEMNRVLQKAFGLDKHTCMDVDTSTLSELQDDTSRYIMELAQAWWLTPNERRSAMNEDLNDDPNMDKIYIPQGFLPIDEATSIDLQNPLAAEGVKPGASGGFNNPNAGPKGQFSNQNNSQMNGTGSTPKNSKNNGTKVPDSGSSNSYF